MIMTTFFKNFAADDRGAAAAEYVLILAIVGAGIGAGALYLGGKISGALSARGDTLSNCAAGTTTC
jgi:pilus assembly protein Flp/PilA